MNPFFKFLSDLFTRLFSDKPQFFKIIQWISFITGGISAGLLYLPTISDSLPSWISVVGNLNVVIISVVSLILAQLPTKSE